jgi:hypothetical protein
MSILWVQMFAIFFLDSTSVGSVATVQSSWHAAGRGVLTAVAFVLGAEMRPSAAIKFAAVALVIGSVVSGSRVLGLAACSRKQFRLPGKVSLGHARDSVVFIIGFILCLLPLHTC